MFRRSKRFTIAAITVSLLFAIVVALTIGGDPAKTPLPIPTTTPTTPSMPTPIPEGTATPTVEEVLLEFLLCERLRVNLYMDWGQAPGTITSNNPDISGRLEPGDYIRLLMPQPDEERRIRVEVFPHDGRAVGRTDNMVWISWYSFYAVRNEHTIFTCEG